MKPTAMMVGREFDHQMDPGQFGEEERRESERMRHEIAYDQDFESEGDYGEYNQNDLEDGENSRGEPDVLQLNSDDDGDTQTAGEDDEWVDEGEWDQDDDYGGEEVHQDNTWVDEESVGEDGDEVNIWEQKMALDAMHHDGAGQNMSYEEEVDADDHDSDRVDWTAKTAARYAMNSVHVSSGDARTNAPHDNHKCHHDNHGHGKRPVRFHATAGVRNDNNVERECDVHHLNRRLSEEEGEEENSGGGGDRDNNNNKGSAPETGGRIVRGAEAQKQHVRADQDRDGLMQVRGTHDDQRVEYVHGGGSEAGGSLSPKADAHVADLTAMHSHIDALLGSGSGPGSGGGDNVGGGSGGGDNVGGGASREVANMRPTTRGRDVWQDAARPGTRGGRPPDTGASRPGTRRGDHLELARPTTSAGDARDKERDRVGSGRRQVNDRAGSGRRPYAAESEQPLVGRAGSGRPGGPIRADDIPARPETRGRPGLSARGAQQHAHHQHVGVHHHLDENNTGGGRPVSHDTEREAEAHQDHESGSKRGEGGRRMRDGSTTQKQDSSDDMDTLAEGTGRSAGERFAADAKGEEGHAQVDFLNLDDDDEEEEEEAY